MNGKRITRNVRNAKGSLMGVSLSYRLLRSKRWRKADGNVIKKVIEVSAEILKDIPKNFIAALEAYKEFKKKLKN